LVAKGDGLENPWLLWLSKIFMTKKNDVILYVKVWIIIIYEYIILNAFQILQEKNKINNKIKNKNNNNNNKRLVI
jgi:hypothetical protein